MIKSTEIKKQILIVAIIWSMISILILLKSQVINPAAELVSTSLSSELISWTYSLLFLPLVVVIVNRIATRKKKIFLLIISLVLLIFIGSLLWHKLFTKEVLVTLPVRVEGLPSVEGPYWSDTSDKSIKKFSGSFLRTDAFDMFFSYIIIVGISFAVCVFRILKLREVTELRLNEQLSRSKMNLLKSQVHPHFMFNTLNTVSGLMDKDVDKAQQVLEDLSFLLRTSLKQSQQKEVSLMEELEFVKKYLEIEQVRFGNDLNIQWEISEELYNIAVPHMILQPLIENTIKHGFIDLDREKKLLIKAVKEDDLIKIVIEDNGQGITKSFKKGIGLNVVDQRLKAMYGEIASLQITPILHYGTKAEITFPFKIYEHKLVIN